MGSADRFDVAVVGGGIGGLAASALAARAGARVLLLERSGEVGGRAGSELRGGFVWNLGPHALYRGGAAERVLATLGVATPGASPAARGLAARDGRVFRLPAGPASLFASGLLGLGEKIETARLLTSLSRMDPGRLGRLTVAEWLAGAARHPRVRAFVEGLVRLTTYTNAPASQSASVAVAQVQQALRHNVSYLDGGWRSLVAGLERCARSGGVTIRTGARVDTLEPGTVRAAGERIEAGGVVLALPPAEAAALAGSPSLHAFAQTAVPVRAACLDLGLSRLPRPRQLFALGVDRPLYLSVHSAYARLAPDGAASVHLAKYLPAGAPGDPAMDERELEGFMDLVQPGWRAHLLERRFLPRLTVMGAVPTLAGAPGPALADAPGVFVCGDWVGPGLLADAVLGSAERAAALALRTGAPRLEAVA